VGDSQHVAGSEKAARDAPVVNYGPVGAAQVANENLALAAGQAAMATGYPRRVKPDIASAIATDERQWTIKTEVGVAVQRDEAREHGQNRRSAPGESQPWGNPQQELAPREFLRAYFPLKSNLRRRPRRGHGLSKIHFDQGWIGSIMPEASRLRIASSSRPTVW
jgi:hypothetical protein